VIRPPRARVNFLSGSAQAPALSTRGFLLGCGIGAGAALALLILAGWLIG